MNSSLYEGREQTQVKHWILEEYLSAAYPIVGSWAADLAYIDCLAGPWETRDPNFEDTSFAQAIQVLRRSRSKLAERRKFPTIRCLLIEKDKKAFEQLHRYANGITDLDLAARNWDFTEHIQDVVTFSKQRKNSFPFFFIDPTGWELAAVDLLGPILRVRPGEVLINLMTSWIKRFLSDESKNFERLVGPHIGRIRQLSGDEQEEELVRCYSDGVRSAGSFDYVCTLPVMKTANDTFHFWMVYGTRHPKGVEVFKTTEKRVIPMMHETRAESQQRRKVEQSGQLTFLSPAEAYLERRFSRLRAKNLELARNQTLGLLRQSQSLSFDDVWAASMAYALVSESDLKDWIADWIKKGNLELRALKGAQRVVKRGQGNILVWKG